MIPDAVLSTTKAGHHTIRQDASQETQHRSLSPLIWGSPCSPCPGQSTHHALQLWDSNPHLENTGAMQDAPTTFISSRHSVPCRGHWVRHTKLVEHCGKWPRHPGNSGHFPVLYKFFHAIISDNTNVRAKVQASHLVPQTPFGNPKLFLVRCSLW